MSEERRSSGQLIVAISSVVSVIVGAVSLMTFVQSSEKRITTMEVKIETLKDSIDQLRLQLAIPVRR